MEKNGTLKTTAKQYGWSTIFGKRELPNAADIPDLVKPKYKNGVSDWIGPKKDDTKPILYVSSIAGSKDWEETDFTKNTGIKQRCYSFAYCGESSPLVHKKHVSYLAKSLDTGVRVFMDSGAHTLHRVLRSGKTLAKRVVVPKELRQIFIEYLSDEFLRRYAEYIRWCYHTNKHFDFWVTLDSQKNCKIIYENTKKIAKLVGIAPVPVYHGDASLDWVRRYIDDGHKLIGIGISARLKGQETRHRYYSELHELTERHGVSTHGFALTGDRMFRYPFYSVDSATHIKAASFGKILNHIPEKQRIAQIHISEQFSDHTAYGNIASMSKGVKKSLAAMVEADGFDFDDLVKNLNWRIYYNAFVLAKAVKEHTKKRTKFKTWQALV